MRIWADTFNVTTPDDTSVVVRRDFDAPPRKVWRALTEPDTCVAGSATPASR